MFVESNAASILTAAPANALRKGGGRGLHLDMLGVGCVIAAASVWSCPMPMGTIPHSPQHARVLATLVEYEQRGEVKSKVVSAIETRVSNFVSHALIVLTVLLARDVISAVPTAVMSGYLCYTGWTSLESNGMFKRALLAVTSRECHPTSSYIRRAPLKTLHLYTTLQALRSAVFALRLIFRRDQPSSDGFPAGLLFPVALAATILVKVACRLCRRFLRVSLANGRDDSEFFTDLRRVKTNLPPCSTNGCNHTSSLYTRPVESLRRVHGRGPGDDVQLAAPPDFSTSSVSGPSSSSPTSSAMSML